MVLIVADDMGWNDISMDSTNSTAQTPNIDALAEESVAFSQGDAAHGTCAPGRAPVPSKSIETCRRMISLRTSLPILRTDLLHVGDSEKIPPVDLTNFFGGASANHIRSFLNEHAIPFLLLGFFCIRHKNPIILFFVA